MAKTLAIIGGQTGDEGKGKIVDAVVNLASKRIQNHYGKPIGVMRFQGADNAGHTLNINGKEIKLHTVPSGIFAAQAYNLNGSGMFVNPRSLKQEIDYLHRLGAAITPENFGVAANAHVILDYHTHEDACNLMKAVHTSTGKGVMPVSRDKQARVGIRFVEFLDPKIMGECLRRRFPKGMSEGPIEAFVESYAKERVALAPFVVFEPAVLKKQGSEYWIGEGAQGFMLDVDYGAYPGITSSNSAIPPRLFKEILGVFKLYCSSVGLGDRPFVGQLEPELEMILREKWHERGATTGKARSLAWFDAVAANYAIESAGINYLAATCGDRMEELANLGVKPKITTAYEVDGRCYEGWESSFQRRDTLYRAVPVLEEFEPWEKFAEPDGALTPKAQAYVRRIEALLGKEFVMFSNGPKREDLIFRKDILIK